MTTADKSSTINTYYLIKFPDPEDGHEYQCVVEGYHKARSLTNHNNKIYAIQVDYDKIAYEIGNKPYPSHMTGTYEEWYVYNDNAYFAEIEAEDLESAKLLLEVTNF